MEKDEPGCELVSVGYKEVSISGRICISRFNWNEIFGIRNLELKSIGIDKSIDNYLISDPKTSQCS